jgi:PAS domain S-box-containing protein
MKQTFPTMQSAPESATRDPFDDLPLPYIELDAKGIVTRANRATLALHPLEHGALIGKMAWDLMATDEKESSCAAYLLLMESGEEPPIVERSLYTRLGQFHTYEMHRSLMRDTDGRPAGMRILCVDVTEAKRALDEERRARIWMESMMDSVDAALIVTDAMGLICVVNPAAEKLLGWKARELMGKAIENALPMAGCARDEGKASDFATKLEGHCKGIATILDRQGREVRVEIASSPIVDKASGFTTGVFNVLNSVADEG